MSKLLFFILIALLLDIFIAMFSIIITFVLFRIISGGVHMSTFYRCFVTSLVLFVIPPLLLQDLPNTHSILYLIIITFIFSSLVTILYVPHAAHNRPIAENKKLFFKQTSIGFLLIWLIINIILHFFFLEFPTVSFFSSVGLLLQSFTLTPFGYKFLYTIDHFFQLKKERSEVERDEKSF